jgi:hypothetical protein
MSARIADFNYEHFSFALEDEELPRWLHAGPKVGQPAPDFSLPDINGDNAAALADLTLGRSARDRTRGVVT